MTLGLGVRLLVLGALLLGGMTVNGAAMSVTPLQVEMTSAGKSSRSQVMVTNTGSKPLPVSVSLQKLAIDESGNRHSSPAGEHFLVFPPQAMVPVGGTQVFRVQWVGEPLLKASETYMLSVGQIPVKLPTEQSAVQLVASFGVVINVAPPQGEAQLRVVSTGIVTDKGGKRHPAITVENPTNVHALLPQSTIRISSGSWSETLTPALLSQHVGIGIVQPGKRRMFILPIDLPPRASSIQATLDYKPKKGR